MIRKDAASLVVDVCADLLQQKGGLMGQTRTWLTSDIIMRLDTASSWLTEALRTNERTLRLSRQQTESETVSHPFISLRRARILMAIA